MKKQEESIIIGKSWRPVVVLIILVVAAGNLTPEQIELLASLVHGIVEK